MEKVAHKSYLVRRLDYPNINVVTIYADNTTNCDRKLVSLLTAHRHSDDSWLNAILPPDASPTDTIPDMEEIVSWLNLAKARARFYTGSGYSIQYCDYSSSLNKYKSFAGFQKAAIKLLETTGVTIETA